MWKSETRYSQLFLEPSWSAIQIFLLSLSLKIETICTGPFPVSIIGWVISKIENNNRKILLGRITIDDIVDLIKDEAEKDYQLASGISSEVEANDSIFELTKARLPWLFLGLLGGIGSVFILKDFEQIMNEPNLRNLFFYTPLIAAMAGNVGVQSSAIIVQGLANDVVKGSLKSR